MVRNAGATAAAVRVPEPAPASLTPGRHRPAGLTTEEAGERLSRYGPNEIQEHRQSALIRLLSHFWGPIPWMIEAAAVLSVLVRHWTDLGIILVLLVVNGAVAFWEEHQAGSAIEALKARLAPTARVERDGEWRTIPARELVPGDLVRLRLGDVVPADVSLVGDEPLEVDQSVLTGESLPVERGAGEAVPSGATVVRGEGEARVTATGAATEFGRTAQLVEVSGSPSHFQRAVLKIGDYLIVLAAAMVAVILVAGLFRGASFVTDLQFALVLTVAAIPVAMPAVLSVTMAVGARALARRDAIASRLSAVEELAGVDVLCSDKTGTLTQNRLTVDRPWAVPGVDVDTVRLVAALASRQEDGDPIDRAVVASWDDPGELERWTVTRFRPFDPTCKHSEAEVRAGDGTATRVVKGAPQAILTLAGGGGEAAAGYLEAVDRLASRGFRSLGVARAEGEGAWQLLGLLPLFDPPREDSAATIDQARAMGIEVKMVTGDQLAIAREIARRLGLGDRILPADQLDEGPERELGERIERADGFAQVYPEHKHRIVDRLQRRGHLVGMTGDGVNDAPALKQADAGIAVDGATDAARASAAIVLTSPGLGVIVDAVRESRKIFRRMNGYAIYRIAETIRVLLFMTLSILAFNFYPVTAVMIVLLALLNDIPILTIAVDRVQPSERPVRWNMSVVLGVATALGLAGVAASFGLFYLGERLLHLDRDLIQTLMFLKLAVAGHLTIFLTRTEGPFWSSRPAPALLWTTVATKLLATAAAVYGLSMSPIGWRLALLVWAYSAIWFVVNDGIKILAYRIFDPSHNGLLTPRRIGGTSHVRAT